MPVWIGGSLRPHTVVPGPNINAVQWLTVAATGSLDTRALDDGLLP